MKSRVPRNLFLIVSGTVCWLIGTAGAQEIGRVDTLFEAQWQWETQQASGTFLVDAAKGMGACMTACNRSMTSGQTGKPVA